MRLLLIFCAVAIGRAEQSPAERLIEAGHWKRARTLVETRLREAPADALSQFLLSQIRGAFGDRLTPLTLAEKAVSLDGGDRADGGGGGRGHGLARATARPARPHRGPAHRRGRAVQRGEPGRSPSR